MSLCVLPKVSSVIERLLDSPMSNSIPVTLKAVALASQVADHPEVLYAGSRSTVIGSSVVHSSVPPILLVIVFNFEVPLKYEYGLRPSPRLFASLSSPSKGNTSITVPPVSAAEPLFTTLKS